MNFIKKIFGKHLFLNLWYSFSIAWIVHLFKEANLIFEDGWRWSRHLEKDYFDVELTGIIYIFLTALVYFTVRDYLKDKTI